MQNSNFIKESTNRENIDPEKGIESLNIKDKVFIHIIPQSHIDLIWYWSPSEAKRMILETFRGHVELLEKNPNYTYVQSQAAAYKIVLEEDPQLFSRIQRLVKKGQWEIVGGEWVEADSVIPGPEARIRHFLLGQNFFKKYFGKKAVVGWSPDSFIMHPGTFPGILKKAGIRYFIHKRPRERYGHLPIIPYIWKGIDNTEIISYRANNKGNGIPTLSEGTIAPKEKGDLTIITDAFLNIGSSQLYAPMGVGDIGGVNTYSPFPLKSSKFERSYSTVSSFFSSFLKEVDKKALPVIYGDLSPVFTGSLTTWWYVKTLNRRCENLLLQTEFIISLAREKGLKVDAGVLRRYWEKVLYYQFHDSAGGCGTEDIRKIVEVALESVLKEVEELKIRYARQIAEKIKVDFNKGVPITIFNPLGWEVDYWGSHRITIPSEWLDLVPRTKESEVYCVDIRDFVNREYELEAVDYKGEYSVPVEIERYAQFQSKAILYVRFLAKEIPAFGYKTYYIRKRKKNFGSSFIKVKRSQNRVVLSTDKIKLSFDLKKGGINLIEIGEKEPSIKVFSSASALGRLAIYFTGKYDINYGKELRAWQTGFTGKVKILKPIKYKIKHYSGYRRSVIFEYKFRNSTFYQEFLIEPHANFVESKLWGNWQEIEKYLKILFTFDSFKDLNGFADLSYGFTKILPNRKEYPMQYFCGIHNGDIGISIFNNSKYGCMVEDGKLSISVIRCATYPAKISDRGYFEFNYRIKVFHLSNNWEKELFKEGFSYNISPFSYSQEYSENFWDEDMYLFRYSFKNVLLTSLKPSEDKTGMIIRIFNPSSKRVREDFSILKDLYFIEETNLLEESIKRNFKLITFRPYEIKSFLLKKK